MENQAQLKINHVGFTYASQCGKQPFALNNINFEVPCGEFISIIGSNGSGKTTLFHIMCGALKTQNGTVIYHDKDVHQMDALERAKAFAVIHQKEELNFPFTCIEMVVLGLYPHRARFEKLTKEQLERVKDVMDLTDTYRFADKPITQISGGEMQRVTLARALIQNPQILFLDEAMSDMDICAKIKMTKLLKQFVSEKKRTVIAINHDMNAAYKFSDRIIAMKDGFLVACGSPKAVMTEHFFQEVFQVKAEIIEDKGVFIQDISEKKENR